MSSKSLPVFLRLSDLAEAAKSHPTAIERLLYRDVINADAEIQHGRSRQPIFAKSRLAALLKAIEDYRESTAKVTA
jgi:hypothetical protein